MYLLDASRSDYIKKEACPKLRWTVALLSIVQCQDSRAKLSGCRPLLRQTVSPSPKPTRVTPFIPDENTMTLGARVNYFTLLILAFLALFVCQSTASLGDHLPDFKECVQVYLVPRFR